jgi:hypothetical protein
VCFVIITACIAWANGICAWESQHRFNEAYIQELSTENASIGDGPADSLMTLSESKISAPGGFYKRTLHSVL